MTTPLLLLRAVQIGVQIGEMELLTIGCLMDMFTEMQRDEEPPVYIATQEQMDKF